MIQSVVRALDLVDAVSAFPQGAGLSELAVSVNIKAQTANTLLKTLVARKYLCFNEGTRKYSLGLELLNIANRIDSRQVIERAVHLIRPHLVAASADVAGQLLVVMYFRSQFIVVGRTEGDSAIKQNDHYFVEHPHHLATGTVLLAHRAQDFIEAYLKEHPEARKHRLILSKARRDGYYARKDKGGQVAIAVPVPNAANEVCFSIGTFFSPRNLGKNAERRILKGLQRAANTIAAALADKLPV